MERNVFEYRVPETENELHAHHEFFNRRFHLLRHRERAIDKDVAAAHCGVCIDEVSTSSSRFLAAGNFALGKGGDEMTAVTSASIGMLDCIKK